MERASGILLPLFSLPSPYGIGTMGRAAYEFADFLHAAGQRYWQLLPLGPTGYGDSPYQSFSTYAGNPYFIDLELLAEDGLLTQAELSAREWGNDPRRVDYGAVYENRLPLLRLAKARGWQRDRDAVAAFAALLLLVLDNAHVTLPEINTLERDVPDLTAGSVVYELYLSGVLNGVDEYGTFDGQHTVTRGQAAAMLARLVDPAQRLKLSFQSFSQCRDILGVDPAAVLLMVDGADFTAEDCSEALYQGLRKQYNHLLTNGNQDIPAALTYLEKTVKLYAAREALAASLNLTVTDAEVDQRGPLRDGYQGQTTKSLRVEARQTILTEKLLAYFEAQYGKEVAYPGMGVVSVGQERLDAALDKLCAAMTVQRSETLKNLDLQAVQTRLVKAPGSVGTDDDPYR